MIFQPQFSNESTPLIEYPRPQMQRDSYFSLNGEWDYAISTADHVDFYDGKITVPYSPECELSGVLRQFKKNEYLFYRKSFTLPSDFNKGRVLLNVGACDQITKVYLNGKLVAENEGGYLPFSADITDALKDGKNELTFTVTDDADSDVYGRGKQKYRRGGIWYTATSGIWQSVWLESVPSVYIKRLILTPDFDAKRLTVKCEGNDVARLTAQITADNGEIISGSSDNCLLELDVPQCKPWSPDSPELYPIKITYGEDEVRSYFGLRKFSTVDVRGKKLLSVNGKPVFHNGLLDQGYWHDGLLTPPSNRAMYDQVKAVKELGYNMLRKHIKVEPLLWYYYCDILGVLVWQDMLNGGGAYSPFRIALCPFFDLKIDDSNYKAMKRSEQSRKTYYKEAHGLMDLLYSTVSLCLWTPFNECWGQFDAIKVWKELSARDETRLYDHASGWQDKGGGDINSKHVYFRKARIKNDGKRVLALTEFGGYSYAVKGHVFSKKKFGYKMFADKEKLTRAIEKLYYGEVIPLIEKQALGATVYTELTDVEDEVNGLFTFDGVQKISSERIKRINSDVYAAFERMTDGH